MPYSKRIPPIKILLSDTDFNKLIELLDDVIDSNNEDYSNKSTKMKEKLLRYTVPIIKDDGTTMVDIRCYNNEIVDLFYILFFQIGNVSINTNYYDVLLRVREKIKNQNMLNE